MDKDSLVPWETVEVQASYIINIRSQHRGAQEKGVY